MAGASELELPPIFVRAHFDNETNLLAAVAWLQKAHTWTEDDFFGADTLYLILDVEIPRHLLSSLGNQPGFVRMEAAGDYYQNTLH